MFENMSFDNIMVDMMADMPDDISTEEGSLLYNACAKMALKLEEAYVGLEYLFENLSPDTMDEEHLIKYAKERGLSIRQATNAVFQAEFEQEIPIGTRFSLNDLNYITTEKISDFCYKIECETAGKVGNNYFGELSAIDYIADWKGGRITKLLIPAEDMADIEEIRQELFTSFDTKAFAGNRAAYISYINNISGVGGVKIKRRNAGDSYIQTIIINSDYKTASDELVNKVQTQVDPEQNHGEGLGMAAIGQSVLIASAIGVKIDVLAQIEFEAGKTFDDLKSYIESAIDDYFLSLAKEWETSSGLTVRVYQIITAMASVKGIVDIKEITLNGSSENIILTEEQIPIRGDVNAV